MVQCDSEPGQLMSRQAATAGQPGQARLRSEVSGVEQDGVGPGQGQLGCCTR